MPNIEEMLKGADPVEAALKTLIRSIMDMETDGIPEDIRSGGTSVEVIAEDEEALVEGLEAAMEAVEEGVMSEDDDEDEDDEDMDFLEIM